MLQLDLDADIIGYVILGLLGLLGLIIMCWFTDQFWEEQTPKEVGGQTSWACSDCGHKSKQGLTNCEECGASV